MDFSFEARVYICLFCDVYCNGSRIDALPMQHAHSGFHSHISRFSVNGGRVAWTSLSDIKQWKEKSGTRILDREACQVNFIDSAGRMPTQSATHDWFVVSITIEA